MVSYERGTPAGVEYATLSYRSVRGSTTSIVRGSTVEVVLPKWWCKSHVGGGHFLCAGGSGLRSQDGPDLFVLNTESLWAMRVTEMCSGFEAGSYLRRIDFCVAQL